MRNPRQGLTVAELLVVVFIVIVFAGMLLPSIRSRPSGARRIACRSNLNQLGKGMATYLNEHGDCRWHPCPLGRGAEPADYNGAEWLASLYWTGVVPDPHVFICPSSPDTNHDGRDLGSTRVAPTFGSQTVSYAALHYWSLTSEAGRPRPGAIPDDFPPDEAMASDDTQGAINHGTKNNGGMAILFFDTHVEFKTHTELDLERGVGATAPTDPQPLLWRLRN